MPKTVQNEKKEFKTSIVILIKKIKYANFFTNHLKYELTTLFIDLYFSRNYDFPNNIYN